MGHPAHFHLFRNVIAGLKNEGHEVQIVIRKKDILEDLLKSSGWEYTNILPYERKNSKAAMAVSTVRKDIELFKIARSFRPQLMLGTSAEIAHTGRLLNIPSIVVNEDDYNVVPLFSFLAYPFAAHILAPHCCRTGRWKDKTVSYEGYHELAYLHLNLFTPDFSRIKNLLHTVDEDFFILRFAKLAAHHDKGKTGITGEIAEKIIRRLEKKGRVFITSERELEREFEKYRINLNPMDIHHALAFAELYIGDSQTMAAEAAVLGTPSLRFNDFVGRIGYLEELEHRYELTYGFKTSEPQRLLEKIDFLLELKNKRDIWQKRRKKMLEEKIDLTAFMLWLISNYPESIAALKRGTGQQYVFDTSLKGLITGKAEDHESIHA